MRRTVLAVSAAGVALLIALGGTIVSAAPSGGIGGRPAHPDPKNPRTNTIFIYTLDRGQSKDDQVIVSNSSDQTQTIDIYAVDGTVTSTGDFTCKQQSEPRHDIGAWLKLARSQLTLKSGAHTTVDFTLTMARNADVGEHDGCIVIQSAEPDEGNTTGSIRLRTRQAIRVVATVPGDLKRDIEIAGFGVSSTNHGKQLTLKVSNTGNVSADVRSLVHLRTLWGSDYFSNGGDYPVLADQTLELPFVVDKQPLFGGWYVASGDIAYDKRAGAFGTNDPTQLIHKDSKRYVVYLAPTPLGMLILFVIILAVAAAVAWLVLRRRERLEARKSWFVYRVAEGDTLESLARQSRTDWRKLARVNTIKAPYVLKSGQRIRLPVPAKTEKPKKTRSHKGS